jgi:hypothetical protein
LVSSDAPVDTACRCGALVGSARQEPPGHELSAVEDFLVELVRRAALRNLLRQDDDVGGAG